MRNVFVQTNVNGWQHSAKYLLCFAEERNADISSKMIEISFLVEISL